MGKKEKLIQRLKSKPKDFTFREVESLLGFLDYEKSNQGKTSGSMVLFERPGYKDISLHKPHPEKELRSYQVRQIISILEKEGLL